MDSFAQKEAQEIEAASLKKKKGKSVAPDNEIEELQETDNETDDYENSVNFFEIV